MKGGIAEKIECPKQGSHPRLGRKGIIKNEKVMGGETIFRDRIKKEYNRREYNY